MICNYISEYIKNGAIFVKQYIFVYRKEIFITWRWLRSVVWYVTVIDCTGSWHLKLQIDVC